MLLTKIKLNPANPRVIRDANYQKLVESLKHFPRMMELRPIVIDENGIIQGGNTRYKALLELGYKEVPEAWIKKADDFTLDELREFIIKDNILYGEWDWQLLTDDWDKEQLIEWGLDVAGWPQPKVQEDDYEIPDEIETDIVLGDLFEIGQHRLMCGDSTKADDVSKLLDGAKPNLMVTDPPYGVNYSEWRTEALKDGANRANGKVINDDVSSWLGAYSLFTGNVVYVWHSSASASAIQFANDLMTAGFIIVNQIIWAKNNIVISRGDYHWQHEPCWYAVRKGKKHNWQGSRKENTLWQIDKPLKSETGHSTQKPVECMARPIRNNSKEIDEVYDPFLGSGTTMVAAHQLNRKCYGMEIEPKYCQIIIDRMKKLDPTLQIKRNDVANCHT